MNDVATANFDPTIRASTLIEALPYIQKLRGQTIVIKYGGSAMERPDLVESTLKDIVFLEAVGINPVVVHGGGKAISTRMKEKGLESHFVHGLRVTDEPSVRIVDEVLNKVINPDIVARINSMGGHARSYQGNRVLRVKKKKHFNEAGEEIDLGYVGEVIGCDVFDLRMAISHEVVPVVSPVGEDRYGHPYNVNADTAAAEITMALNAGRIIYLSDVRGILKDPSNPETLIPTVTQEDVEQLRVDGVLSGGMIPKMDSALQVLHSGTEKVHLIDGRIPHALLLELFTDRGIGTEIIH
ncbi:MAG: acetylglutamate kinase [Verrucomicrobiota bacterium]